MGHSVLTILHSASPMPQSGRVDACTAHTDECSVGPCCARGNQRPRKRSGTRRSDVARILSNYTLWTADMGILWPHFPRGELGVSSKSGTSHAGVASDPGRWEGYTHRLVQVAFGIQTRDPAPTGGYSTPIDCLEVLEPPTATPNMACEHPRTYGGPSTYWTALPQRARRRPEYRATSGLPAHGRRSQ